jgi:sporulation protein YlmC with PRC-barrel domain
VNVTAKPFIVGSMALLLGACGEPSTVANDRFGRTRCSRIEPVRRAGPSVKKIFVQGTRIQHGRLRAAQIIALKQKENPMLRKLALSASVLALAGSLAVAQAETMRNSSSGRSVAAPSSLSTMHWLASDIYKADVYDNAEDKIGVVTDLIVDNNGTVTTVIVSVGGLLGVGKKDVAVPFKSLKVASRDGKDWLVLNQTKEDLKMAPAYDKKTNSQM